MDLYQSSLGADTDSWKVEYVSYLRRPFQGGDYRSMEAEEFLTKWSQQMAAERAEMDDSENQVMMRLQKIVNQGNELVTNCTVMRERVSSPFAFSDPPVLPPLNEEDIFADLGITVSDEDKQALRKQWLVEDAVLRGEFEEQRRNTQKEVAAEIQQREERWKAMYSTPNSGNSEVVGVKSRKGGISVNLTTVNSQEYDSSRTEATENVSKPFIDIEELEKRDRQREEEAQRELETALQFVDKDEEEFFKEEEKRINAETQEVVLYLVDNDPTFQPPTEADVPAGEAVCETNGQQQQPRSSVLARAHILKKKRRVPLLERTKPREAKERILMHREDVASQFAEMEAEKRMAKNVSEITRNEADARNDVRVREDRLFSSLIQREKHEKKAILEWIVFIAEKLMKDTTQLVSQEESQRNTTTIAEETERKGIMVDEVWAKGRATTMAFARETQQRYEAWQNHVSTTLSTNASLFEAALQEQPTPRRGPFIHNEEDGLLYPLGQSRETVLVRQKDMHRHWMAKGSRPPSASNRKSSNATPRDTPTPLLSNPTSSQEKMPSGVSESEKVLLTDFILQGTDAQKTGIAQVTLEGIVGISNLHGCENFLRELHVSVNKIRSIHPELLSLHPHLKVLSLNDNEMVSMDVSSLTSSSSIERLDISMNKFTTVDFVEIMPHLTSFIAKVNAITNLRGLSSAQGLRTVDVQDNALTSLGEIQSLQHLTALNAGKNQLTDFACINSFPLLQELILFTNQIPKISEGLQNCILLRQFFINQNRITSLPVMFSPLLYYINLSGNQLTDLEPLKVCLMLETLDVSFNLLNNAQSVIDALWPLRRLQSLNITDNPITSKGSSTGQVLKRTLGIILPNLRTYNSEDAERNITDFKACIQRWIARDLWWHSRSPALTKERIPLCRTTSTSTSWAVTSAYDYFCFRQSLRRKAQPHELFTEQKIFNGGIELIKDNQQRYSAFLKAHNDKVIVQQSRKRIALWCFKQYKRKKYTAAVLKIQPRWKGALVRMRLWKHQSIIDDIDIDGFGEVTLEDKYVKLTVHRRTKAFSWTTGGVHNPRWIENFWRVMKTKKNQAEGGSLKHSIKAIQTWVKE
eukprot:PhF_6_TR8319/c0_g2_i3/m.12927